MRLADVADILKNGRSVAFRPSGHSMEPIIRHRQLVSIAPVDSSLLERGDVVFAKVGGRFYLHRIGAIKGNQVRIENYRGHVNGWVHRDNVLGRLTTAA